MVTLVPNGNIDINDIPPGSGAQKFGDPQIMANMNDYIANHPMGHEAGRQDVMMSIVKGLGLDDDPRALALTVPSHGMGQIRDDNLGQYNVSSAGIAAAQQMSQNLDKGTTV